MRQLARELAIMNARRFVYGLAMLLLSGIAAPSYATEPSRAPSAFVADLAEKTHAVLLAPNSQTFSSADRQRHLGGLLNTSFDVPRIASFVLGRYWQEASEVERHDFTAVLREFMLRVMSRNFTGYSERSFRVIGQRAEGPAGTVVHTEINHPASGQPIRVAWHVIDRGGYRIVDMSVAGVSMAQAKRDEFSSYLWGNGGDLPDLIYRLQSIMSAQQSP